MEQDERIIKMLKEHWVEIGTTEEKVFVKTLDPETAKKFQEGMNRLEYDFEFQKQLGIGC